MAGEITIKTLEQALNELRYGGPTVRGQAALALAELNDPATIPHLIESLQDPEPEVRVAAATALNTYRDKRAVPVLLRLLDDTQWPVRESAAIALGLAGDEVAIKPLLKFLDKERQRAPNIEARHRTVVQAAIALGRLKDERAIGVLAKVLEKGYKQALSDWQIQLRQAAALGLGLLNVPKATQALVARLRESENPAVRGSVIKALAMQTGESTFRVLLENVAVGPYEDLRQLWRRQEGIVIALGERGDKRAVPYMLPLVSSEYPEVRIALARALVQLGEDQQTGALYQLLRDRMSEVRAAAVQAMGALQLQEAVNALNVMMQDPDPQVVVAAQTAIENIKQLPPGSLTSEGRYLPPSQK